MEFNRLADKEIEYPNYRDSVTVLSSTLRIRLVFFLFESTSNIAWEAGDELFGGGKRRHDIAVAWDQSRARELGGPSPPPPAKP